MGHPGSRFALAFDDLRADSRELRAHYELLRFYRLLVRDVVGGMDAHGLLDAYVPQLMRVARAERAVLWLREEDDSLAPVHTSRCDGRSGTIAVSKELLQQVLEEQTTELVEQERPPHGEIVSVLVACLACRDDSVGALWLEGAGKNRFEPLVIDFVTEVAGILAFAVDQAVRERLLTEQAIELAQHRALEDDGAGGAAISTMERPKRDSEARRGFKRIRDDGDGEAER